jgi:translation initiation factor IF-1
MPEAAGRETLEVEGTVRELLPNALVRVELASGCRG